MSETLKALLEYLQQKIDRGEHKIFYNNLMYEGKTIDCINAIDCMNAIKEQQKEIERLENENERYRIALNEMAINICNAIEYIETHLDNTFKTEFDYITTNPQELLGILKGRDKE